MNVGQSVKWLKKQIITLINLNMLFVKKDPLQGSVLPDMMFTVWIYRAELY